MKKIPESGRLTSSVASASDSYKVTSYAQLRFLSHTFFNVGKTFLIPGYASVIPAKAGIQAWSEGSWTLLSLAGWI